MNQNDTLRDSDQTHSKGHFSTNRKNSSLVFNLASKAEDKNNFFTKLALLLSL